MLCFKFLKIIFEKLLTDYVFCAIIITETKERNNKSEVTDMNIENEIEKILDKNNEQRMRWMELFVKAHREGKENLANLCWKQVELLKAKEDGIYQVAELVEKMLSKI